MARQARSWLAIAIATSIGVTAAYSVVVDRLDAGRMPAEALVREANAALMTTLSDERPSGVRTYPNWFLTGRLGLDRVPILAGREVDTWEAARYERVFQAFPESYRALADHDAEVLGLQAFETVFERDGYIIRGAPGPTNSAAVVWDALDALQDAEVRQVTPDGEETECSTWTRGGWHCGRYHQFIYVGAGLQQMGDQDPHRCIVANPPEGNAAWNISWTLPPANGTEDRTLRWRAGNTFEAIRTDRGTPVEFTVRVDGDVVSQESFPIHDLRYATQSTSLSANAQTVQFEIHAENHMDRFFCFYPQVVVP